MAWKHHQVLLVIAVVVLVGRAESQACYNSSAECNNVGTCYAGQCWCWAGYTGSNCELQWTGQQVQVSLEGLNILAQGDNVGQVTGADLQVAVGAVSSAREELVLAAFALPQHTPALYRHPLSNKTVIPQQLMPWENEILALEDIHGSLYAAEVIASSRSQYT